MSRDLRRSRMDRKILDLILKGKTHRQICRDLKVGSRRVNRVSKLASEHGYLDGMVVPPDRKSVV